MPKPITQVDPQTVRLLLEEAGRVLSELAEKHGIRVLRKRCTYSSTEIPVAFKFVIDQRDESGDVVDPMETAFRANAHWFGLDAEDFGKTFLSGRRVYGICGLKTRNRKYPILARLQGTDKTFKFTAKDVRAAIHGSTAAREWINGRAVDKPTPSEED